jgi:hypothetical protein
VGAAMIRMAEIEAELNHIRRAARKGMTREDRETAAEPLRRELDELKAKWWGGAEPPATIRE